MVAEHIVTAYDEELQRVASTVSQMGGMAEAQLADAIRSLKERDTDLAQEVIFKDDEIDRLEEDINEMCIRVLALRQPMALDLREIVAALKISSDVERIADYATNVAKRSIVLSRTPPVKPLKTIPRMAKITQEMIKNVLDAFLERDSDKAIEVWLRDHDVDDMYTSLFRELLTYMMEDPRNISPCTHLLFVAKNIERIGDHATNIAETIHFLVKGTRLADALPDDAERHPNMPGEGSDLDDWL